MICGFICLILEYQGDVVHPVGMVQHGREAAKVQNAILFRAANQSPSG